MMLDDLHSNQATLRTITQKNGADLLLPFKDNHEALHHAAAHGFPALHTSAFPPSTELLPPLCATAESKEINRGRKKTANCAGCRLRRKNSALSQRTRWWK